MKKLFAVVLMSAAFGAVAADAPPQYSATCAACHTTGVGGAPKTHDVAAWEPRLAKGMPVLLESAKNGVPPMMPATGLCGDCTEEDYTALIEFMASPAN